MVVNLGAFNNNSVKAEFIEKIIIPGIPNYIGTSGPWGPQWGQVLETGDKSSVKRL